MFGDLLKTSNGLWNPRKGVSAVSCSHNYYAIIRCFIVCHFEAWLARATRQDRHGWEPWCKIGTFMSHGDRSMAAGSRGAGRHSCESRAGTGLGQVVRNRMNCLEC